jgi:hypothetical protein
VQYMAMSMAFRPDGDRSPDTLATDSTNMDRRFRTSLTARRAGTIMRVKPLASFGLGLAAVVVLVPAAPAMFEVDPECWTTRPGGIR